MTAYIAGPITGEPGYRLKFAAVAYAIHKKKPDAAVLNPASLPAGMARSDYMAIVKDHKAGRLYPNTDFFNWHHRLTGSCEMGRRQFAKEHEIDVENGSMTPEAFIKLTEKSYGGEVIRKLKDHYPEDLKT